VQFANGVILANAAHNGLSFAWPTDLIDPRGLTMNFSTFRSFTSVSALQSSGKDWALLPLRLVVGYGFMAHGLAKFFRGPENFGYILDAIGVPLPYAASWLVVLVEILGGLAFILGAFVALVSIPMAIILFVATFTVHLQHGFSSIKLQAYKAGVAQFGQPGYETDLLYLAGLVTIVVCGSGPFSVDKLLKRSRLKVFETSQ